MRGPASPVRVRPPLPMPGSALATSVPTPLPRAGNAGSAPAAAFSATWGGGIDVGGAPPRLRSATRAPLAHAGGVWERLSPEGVSLPLFLFYPALTGSASSCRTVYCSPWLRPGGIVATYIRFHMTTWLQPAYYVPMATPRVPRGYLVAPSVAPCS